MEFNTADVVILCTVLISTIIGIYRGFVRELLTVMTWVVAAVIAYLYGRAVGNSMVFIENQTVRELLGITFVFFAVVFLGLVLKIIVVKAAKISGVSTVDRVIGGLFGVLRGCVLVVLVLLLSSNNITTEDWYTKSKLLPQFVAMADFTSKTTPKSWKDDVKSSVIQMVQDKCEATQAEISEAKDKTESNPEAAPQENKDVTNQDPAKPVDNKSTTQDVKTQPTPKEEVTKKNNSAKNSKGIKRKRKT